MNQREKKRKLLGVWVCLSLFAFCSILYNNSHKIWSIKALEKLKQLPSVFQTGFQNSSTKRTIASESLRIFEDQNKFLSLTLTSDFLLTPVPEGHRFTKQSKFSLISKGEEIFDEESGKVDHAWVPISLTISDGNLTSSLLAQWRPRGRMRAGMPVPLMSFLFPKTRSQTAFRGLDKKMKFTSHGYDEATGDPLDGQIPSNQKVIRENLCYAVLRELQIPALRTQLVKVSYHQEGTGQLLTQGHGILTEHKDDLAKRLEWKTLDFDVHDKDGENYLLQEKIPVEDITQMALAQALIGHTDWGPNYNTYRFKDQYGVQRLVGYDFDQCAFVSDEFDQSHPQFNAETFLNNDSTGSYGTIFRDIKNYRESAERFGNETLDFKTAIKSVARKFILRQAAVFEAIAKTELTPKGRSLIELRVKNYFDELRKLVEK